MSGTGNGNDKKCGSECDHGDIEMCMIHHAPVGKCACKFIGSVVSESKQIRHLGDFTDAEREEFQKDVLALAQKHDVAFCLYGQKIVGDKVVNHYSIGQGYLCEYVAVAVKIAQEVSEAVEQIGLGRTPPEKKN